MKFGFLIDHRKCIGCHACSVACKEEHQVPLGVYRTWVKYVEKGAFPNTRRHFTVLRCNHCEDAPCVTICPVTALYKRSDGIVDFNPNTCIGCKACMQACPYDALYIDPNSNTAAKCNFCAHRVEVGLQPSCQIVCPTQAIVSGDLDDPTSLISYLTAREPIRVRKPEKGTKPQLSYIDADESSLTPGATIQPQGFGMWSEVTNPQVTDLSMPFWSGTMTAPSGPDLLQDLSAEAGRTVYNVGHAIPWGKKVSLYIWTKSLAAGAFLVSALGVGAGMVPDSPLLTWGALLLALLFLGITSALLILDLKRPERFYTILLRPQWRSWLTIGSYILVVYGALLGISLLAALFGATSFRHFLLWPGGLGAILASIYTGFLFGQAKGRDLWLSPGFARALAGAGAGGWRCDPGHLWCGDILEPGNHSATARYAAVGLAGQWVHHAGRGTVDAPRHAGCSASSSSHCARGVQSTLLGRGNRRWSRPAGLAPGSDSRCAHWCNVSGRAVCPGRAARV